VHQDLPKQFIDRLKAVTAKRARIVIEHILKHGHITTRAKSWSCEHCTNSTQTRKPDVCRSCYWASPDSYRHVALREIRRLDLSWTDQDTQEYDQLANGAKHADVPLPEFVKAILRIHLKESH